MERTRKTFSSSARQRSNLPDATKAVLGDWMFHHLDFPYPTEQEKKGLMDSTMISLSQINNWFINSRARLWKPLVEKAQDIATRVEAKADRGGRVAGGASGAASGGAGGGAASGAGGAANGSEAPVAGGADAAAQDAAAAALKRRPRHATNPRLSPVATAILRVWLAPQLLGRSPTAAAKSQLATMTGLSPRVLERPALAKLPRGGASDSRGGSGGGRSRSNSKTDMASSSTSPRVRRSGGGSSKGGKGSKGIKSKAGGKGVVGGKGKVRGSSFGGTDSLHLWESLLSTASQALHKFETTAVERKRVHSTSAADMMHFPALEGLHALRKRRCYSLAEDSPASPFVDADLGGSMNTKRMRSASESSIFLPLPSRQSSRRSSFVPAEIDNGEMFTTATPSGTFDVGGMGGDDMEQSLANITLSMGSPQTSASTQGHTDAGEPKDFNDVVAPAELQPRSDDMDDGDVPQVSSSSSSTADDLPAMGEAEASAGAASGGEGECGAGAGGSGGGGPHFVDDSKLGMLVEPSSGQQNGDGGNEVNNAEPAVFKAEIMTEAGSEALLGLAAEGAQMPSEDVPMPVQAHTAP